MVMKSLTFGKHLEQAFTMRGAAAVLLPQASSTALV